MPNTTPASLRRRNAGQRRFPAAALLILPIFLIAFAQPALAAGPGPLLLAGIPADFIFFGLTLTGVAVFHKRALEAALTGLTAIILYKLAGPGFHSAPGLPGLLAHLAHEWVTLTNLFLLLTGFAILSSHFEQSKLPRSVPALLPHGWLGWFLLLAVVFVLSSFVDNIAAALIGGVMARELSGGKVHIGYLAGIVAASNAGGAGSVVGDTTTTMMWIGGVSPLKVVDAYVAAATALVVFGIPASLQQQRYSPSRNSAAAEPVEWTRVVIVFCILASAVLANVTANVRFPALPGHVPVIGFALWAAILATAPLRRPDWNLLPESIKGSIFLLALVLCASLMPVEHLPEATWRTTFGLGIVSSVFDNIPLTALALRQGGYDWGMLAYAVGFGGSMIWFGSSAGVALASMSPEARSTGLWLRHGWHVALAYAVGFFVMLALLGWKPDVPHGGPGIGPAVSSGSAAGR